MTEAEIALIMYKKYLIYPNRLGQRCITDDSVNIDAVAKLEQIGLTDL